MLTPWGDLDVADAHVHLFSHGFFSLLGQQKQCPLSDVMSTLGWPAPPEDPVELAGQWAAELDRHGVARAAVIASIPGDEASSVAGASAYPARLVSAAMVNPLDPAQLARLSDHPPRMICLFPAMHRYGLHDERVTALLDATGGPVFVHCGALSVGVRGRLGLPSLFDMRFSNPVDLHAVALRYPRRPFVIPHFGAGYWREALMVADLCPNVYLDTSSSNSWMKLQPGDVDLAAVFRRTRAVTGAERLLFGTDSSFFPRGWHRAVFDDQVAAMRVAGFDAADAQAVLAGNFQRLFPA
jgi:hypothetical protein